MKLLAALCILAGAILFTPGHAIAATCPSATGIASVSIPAHGSTDVLLDTVCNTITGTQAATFSRLNIHGGGMGADIFDPTGYFIGGGSSSGGLSSISVFGHGAIPGTYTLRIYNPNGQKIKMNVEFQITP